MIRLDGIGARKGRFALRDVTFALDAGAYGVVIGPAGSGKTTLLEVVAGLLPPERGSVALGGADAGAYGVVIGPAGSGKTTLLEVVAGLLPPERGSVALAGADAGGVPPEERGVGLVYQHAFLFPHLSVRENISYGAADVASIAPHSRRRP